MQFPSISNLVDGGARGIDILTGVFIGPRAAFPMVQTLALRGKSEVRFRTLTLLAPTTHYNVVIKKIRKGRQIQHKAASTSKILDLRNSYVVEV